MAVSVSSCTDAADAAALADVAAATFALACPPAVSADDIAAHIAEHLSVQRFTEFLRDPHRRVLAAREDGRIIGYAILVRGSGDSVELSKIGDSVELSKIYVLADRHGSGAAATLMRSAITWAGECGAVSVWLGVNRENERAQRFYRKHGFEVTGTRTFRLGESAQDDFVMARVL